MYVESVAVTTMGIIALTVFRRFEDKNDHVTKRRISDVFGDEAEAASAAVMKEIAELGAVVADVEYERRLDDKPRTTLIVDVTLPVTVGVATLIQALEKHPGGEANPDHAAALSGLPRAVEARSEAIRRLRERGTQYQAKAHSWRRRIRTLGSGTSADVSA